MKQNEFTMREIDNYFETRSGEYEGNVYFSSEIDGLYDDSYTLYRIREEVKKINEYGDSPGVAYEIMNNIKRILNEK